MGSTEKHDIRVLLAGREATVTPLREALEAAGIQVVADCGSQDQVVAALATTRPDVCIVDRDLEGGGLVATAAIATPGVAPRVLVVGGRGSASELRAARLAGAAGSLPGDVDAAALIAAVAALVQATTQ
jgi:two-component system, NarL family, response regulator DesR